MDFEDPKRVIELIRRKLPDVAERLIRVREEPNREAIKELEPRQLASIGASLIATGDEIVIDHPSDEIDALIDALTAEEA